MRLKGIYYREVHHTQHEVKGNITKQQNKQIRHGIDEFKQQTNNKITPRIHKNMAPQTPHPLILCRILCTETTPTT